MLRGVKNTLDPPACGALRHRRSRDALVRHPRQPEVVVQRAEQPVLTWGPQGQGVRAVKKNIKTVGDRQMTYKNRMEGGEKN